MDKLYIYSKVPCTVSVGDLLSRWPSECGAQDIKQHMRYNTNLDIGCISMLGHPIDSITNRVNCNVIHHVMVINPGYTVFKATETAEKSEVWNLASTDSYNLLSEVKGESASYSTVKVEPVVFVNEQDAHSTVAKDFLKIHNSKNGINLSTKWFNNSHSIMDEFVCKSTLIPCSTCNSGTSGVRFDDNTNPLCRACKPFERFKGTPIKVPKVLDMFKLMVAQNVKKEEKDCPVFTKRHMVDKESVVFTKTEELPFIRGEEGMDDEYTSQFLERSTSVVYDIEIITVDSTLKNSIPYEIVTITASFNVGKDMKELVMFTRKLPEAWKTKVTKNGETVDTTALLKDVRVEGATPLPRMKVVKCVGEKELVERFRDYMLAKRPHFFVSYNGEGFDHKFLIRASIANRSSETFRESFNHYTPLVKNTSSKDPTARTDPAVFFKKPAGKHCSGLIPDNVMKVDYETFPAMIGLDLYPIHSTTLDEACKETGVNGGKMDGVSHSDLPRLFYSADMDFFKYAALDVVITSELAVKDRFNSVELFMELEKLVCTPWNLSASRKKTASAQCTTYVQFTINGFVREAKLRPKTLLASVVVDEICRYFVDGTTPRLDETKQIITDFCNGHCKCNTTFKKLPKDFEGVPLTAKSAKTIISAQIRTKNKPFEYTTVDATMIVFFLTRSDIEWGPFGRLLDEFFKLTNDTTNRRLEGLKNFMKYLVQVRTVMSVAGHETATLTWKEYKENHKTDTVVAAELKQFVCDRFEELQAASRQSKMLPKQIDVTAEELADIVRSVVQNNTIKLAMLSYDGALILCPHPTVDLNSLIGVLDFTSQYPYGMINMNLGLESHVSLDVIMACIRQIMDNKEGITAVEAAKVLERRHVNVCFTRRVDDTADWTDYLTQPDYLKRNCVFYIKNRVSVQNHQFKNEIRSRVVDKSKSEDPNLPNEVRKKHKNISNAKKVNINSRYGVIQSVISPLFQPTVTGIGRRSIRWVVKELERLIDAKEVYGDTDSCFTYIKGLNALEMAKASPEWIFERLRFAQFDVSYEQFKDKIYDKYFPVDMSQPRCIRHACGRVVHELYTLIAPRLSNNVLELEPEKTLCGITVKQKKYTAYNCCTQSTLTKGMSIHNKAAFPLTATILKKYNELKLNCWTKWDLARDLYNYIGKEITGPIERGEVDPKLIAKPSSFDTTKLVDNSKKMNLIKSLERSGVNFPYEKVRVLQVTILPEGDDKDWSLCDIKNQSCKDKIHVVKVKFDVLNEIMGCLEILYKAGVCEAFQALMWGEFYLDRYTDEDFKRMDADKPETFKAMSFVAINKRFVNGPPVQKIKKPRVSKRKSSDQKADAVKKQCTKNKNVVALSLSTQQSQTTLWDFFKTPSTSDGALDKDKPSSSSTAWWSTWVKQTR